MQVGLHQSSLESAPASRARVRAANNGDAVPLSVLRNLAIVVDDPVARCARPAPAPSPPPDQAKPTSASAPVARAPSSAPEAANNNSAKKKCRPRPAAAAPPSRPVQVGRRQSSWESARPLARAREGREHGQRCWGAHPLRADPSRARLLPAAERLAARGRPRERVTSHIPDTNRALSGTLIRAGSRLLLCVRATGLSLRLARRSLGHWGQQECGLAHRMRGRVAILDCTE